MLPPQKAKFESRKEPHFVSLVASRMAIQREWERESMKLCAEGFGWNCENEGNVRALGKKTMLS